VFAPVSSMKTSFAPSWLGDSCAQAARPTATSSRCCSSGTRSFFFVTLAEPFERAVNGGDVAIDAQAVAQLFERGVGLLSDEPEQALLIGPGDSALSPRAMVEALDGARVPVLLDELFHQAQGDVESVGDLLACGGAFLEGFDDS